MHSGPKGYVGPVGFGERGQLVSEGGLKVLQTNFTMVRRSQRVHGYLSSRDANTLWEDPDRFTFRSPWKTSLNQTQALDGSGGPHSAAGIEATTAGSGGQPGTRTGATSAAASKTTAETTVATIHRRHQQKEGKEE
jgi:hypothetical protein